MAKSGEAQQRVPTQFAVERPVLTQGDGSEKKQVLEKRVSLELRDAPLDVALAELGRKSGLDVMYSKAMLPVGARVTIAESNRTVRDILDIMLRGTGISARATEQGQIVISAGVRKIEEEQGVIIGRVLHAKTKKPVVGARVILDGANQEVVTGEDGAFRMPIAVGEHRVQVRAVGMVRQSRTVTVRVDATVTVEFLMEESASVLDEVVVTGTVIATKRKAISTPITVIQGEELERRGITRIEQLFRGEVPGVFAADKGMRAYYGGDNGGDESGIGNMISSDVYVRGSSRIGVNASPTPLKTYIDGVEMLDASYLGTIDPQSIERIEIVTGPQAATIYGSGAMGGVMQIFTRKGGGRTTPDLGVNLRYGILQNSLSDGLTPSHNHGVTLRGGMGAGFSYSGTLSYQYTGQWQPALFSRRIGASLGATHVSGPFTVNLSLATTSTRNGTTSGGGNTDSPLGKMLSGNGDWEPTSSRILPPSQRVSTSQSQTVSVDGVYRPSTFWAHSLTLGRSSTTLNVIPERPRFSQSSDSLYASVASSGQRTSLNYNVILTPQLSRVFSTTVTVGANGAYGGQMRVNGCLAASTSTTYAQCNTSGLGVQSSPNSDSWGGFLSWRIGMFDQLYFNLGLRGERNNNYGRERRVDWTPTNGVSYTLEWNDVSVKLLGSYGRATRAPTPEMRMELWTTNVIYDPFHWLARFANDSLRPEYSRGPQGGVEVYIEDYASLSVNRYVQEISDLIQDIYVDSVLVHNVFTGTRVWIQQSQRVNVASIRSHGWELSGTLSVGRLSGKATYSWTDSRIKHSSQALRSAVASAYREGVSFRGAPTHTSHFQITYAHGATSLTLVSNWRGKAEYSSSSHPIWRYALAARNQMYLERIASMSAISWYRLGDVKSDLSASHRLREEASLILHVTNLTNSFESDQDFYYPSLGRQTLLGLSLRFPRSR